MSDEHGTANTGHGHARPRPDGVRARCGGPGLCSVCSAEAARFNRADRLAEAEKLIRAYADEWATPSPDLLYRRTCRMRLFAFLALRDADALEAWARSRVGREGA